MLMTILSLHHGAFIVLHLQAGYAVPFTSFATLFKFLVYIISCQ